MSLSLETPVNITYSTAQDISDEILGGTIRFCRDNGFKQDMKLLTFFWSAFFSMVYDKIDEYDLAEEVANCYVNSLKKVFLELSNDISMRDEAEEMNKRYIRVIDGYFATVKDEEKIPLLFKIIDDKRGQADTAKSDIHKVDKKKSFKHILNVIETNIYNILRQINSEFGVQYREILDQVFYDKYKQKTNNNSQSNNEGKVRTATVSDMNRTYEQKLGMFWYKFLTGFALIVGAICAFIYGSGYITGQVYMVQTNGEINASQVYAHYGRILQLMDVIYGLLLIIIGAMAIVLRNKLVKYKPDAIGFVKIFYAFMFVVPFAYIVIVAVITAQEITPDAVTALIVDISLLVFNVIYFNKREHLFTGENIVNNRKSFSQASKHYSKVGNTGTARIMFCRKCGIRLVDDSEFCHKCGTRIVN